jgi:hypothetical protein
MSALVRALRRAADAPWKGKSVEVTLLELVTAVSQIAKSDEEVVATVMHLLRSGRVRLRGSFRGTLLLTP